MRRFTEVLGPYVGIVPPVTTGRPSDLLGDVGAQPGIVPTLGLQHGGRAHERRERVPGDRGQQLLATSASRVP